MSEFSRRSSHYDDASDDDEAVADSGHNLMYRRLASSAGGVDLMHQPQQQQPALEQSFGGFGSKGHPSPFDDDTSGSIPKGLRNPNAVQDLGDNKLTGDASVSLWAGAGGTTQPVPSRPYGQSADSYNSANPPAFHSPEEQQQQQGYGQGMPCIGYNKGFETESPPRFWSPFGSVGKTTTEGSSSYGDEDSDTPCVITLPSTFRLERTNFVAVSSPSSGQALPVGLLVAALRSALSEAGVDVLEFKPAHCVLECSFHVGNRFLSLFVRVFRAPDRASGQLLNSGNGNDNNEFGHDDEEKAPFLVEAQLREGDRLHFSALFREIMRAFKNQEGVHLAGTFRYQPRPYPGMGEGLALEAASMAPSRNSVRLLAERVETIKSAGNNPAAGVRRMLAEGNNASSAMGMGGAGAGLGPSPPPVPAGMAKTQDPMNSELDIDMMDDVTLLANMLRGSFLDVQADAATAVAGLTADPQLLGQLSRDGASKAANDLTSASARLLVETRHRPARRQAAVVVANLSTTPKLRAALLASDPPPAQGGAMPLSMGQQGRLVDSLVVLAMGIDGGSGGGGDVSAAVAGKKKEEEIGMRRECMRALVGLAECQAVRDTAAMKLLLSTEPTGRGAEDATLTKRLLECRTVLKNRS